MLKTKCNNMEIQKYISRMSRQQFCDSLTAGGQQLCLFPDDETVTRALKEHPHLMTFVLSFL